MMILQGAPYSPRISFLEAPLLYVAVGVCVAVLLAASLRLYLLLKASRRYRIDERSKGSMFGVWPWTSLVYVLDGKNYQPGTAGPIIRGVLKYLVVQTLAWLAGLVLALGFIL